MKRFLLIMLLTLPMMVFSQGKAISTIEFEQELFDFGTIQENKGEVEHIFIFVNNGTKPLIITNVRASCGCTTSEWSKKPVLPGQKGEIKVKFNPKNRPGKFMKSITISNNSAKSIITLTVKGNVIRKKLTNAE